MHYNVIPPDAIFWLEPSAALGAALASSALSMKSARSYILCQPQDEVKDKKKEKTKFPRITRINVLNCFLRMFFLATKAVLFPSQHGTHVPPSFISE